MKERKEERGSTRSLHFRAKKAQKSKDEEVKGRIKERMIGMSRKEEGEWVKDGHWIEGKDNTLNWMAYFLYFRLLLEHRNLLIQEISFFEREKEMLMLPSIPSTYSLSSSSFWKDQQEGKKDEDGLKRESRCSTGRKGWERQRKGNK